MIRRVSLRHAYDVAPATLWRLVTDLDALARANAPRVVMLGLPSGRIHAGQTLDIRVSLFGRLPPQRYSMHVVECDDVLHRFRSVEAGAGVRRWEHSLVILPRPGGALLSEQITIDAVLLTPLFALWARYLYRSRHPARLRMLAEEPHQEVPT